MRGSLLILVFGSVACSSSKEGQNSFSRADSSRGVDGRSCWEAPGMNDRNGDGKIDILDCLGPEGQIGPEGVAGKNCWDDLDDPNGDGVNDAADCRYEIVKPVVYSSKDIVDLNNGAEFFLEVSNVEKACGDVDGCRMIFKAKNQTSGNDNFNGHSWVILAENYQHFFNPVNENQDYNEHTSGVTYRSMYSGGSTPDRLVGTGNSSSAIDYLAYSPNYNLTLRNHIYFHCANFGVSTNQPVHAGAHQFTLEVHADYLGTLIIQNRP
ncbi:MAG: hypothetical protein ACO3LE_08645 [Bdellovibrionota bacterium]